MSKIAMTVTYEGGETVEIVAGQREFAEWERQPFGCSSSDAGEKSPVLFFWFLAFSALKRSWRLDHIQGKPATFEAWADTVADVDPEDDAEEDPTKTDQSTGD